MIRTPPQIRARATQPRPGDRVAQAEERSHRNQDRRAASRDRIDEGEVGPVVGGGQSDRRMPTCDHGRREEVGQRLGGKTPPDRGPEGRPDRPAPAGRTRPPDRSELDLSIRFQEAWRRAAARTAIKDRGGHRPGTVASEPMIGVVLAGGAGTRMGQDKAEVMVAGRPMISWVIERSGMRCRIGWSWPDGPAAGTGTTGLADREGLAGPLAGLGRRPAAGRAGSAGGGRSALGAGRRRWPSWRRLAETAVPVHDEIRQVTCAVYYPVLAAMVEQAGRCRD